MAYTRHNWVCGESIDAERLNNIEDGIEEALECCDDGSAEPLILTQVDMRTEGSTTYAVFNHTWSELRTAFRQGRGIYLEWYVAEDLSEYIPFRSIRNTDDISGGAAILFSPTQIIDTIYLYPNEISGIMEQTISVPN